MSEAQKPAILIYRGIPVEHNKERLGRWWSTDPYYALGYADGGQGKLFVASTDEETLARSAKDASIDEGYANYLFVGDDPRGARAATYDEIEALKSATEYSNNEGGLPGGSIIKRPDNSIEIGQSIFGPKEIGATALAESAILPTVPEQ